MEQDFNFRAGDHLMHISDNGPDGVIYSIMDVTSDGICTIEWYSSIDGLKHITCERLEPKYYHHLYNVNDYKFKVGDKVWHLDKSAHPVRAWHCCPPTYEVASIRYDGRLFLKDHAHLGNLNPDWFILYNSKGNPNKPKDEPSTQVKRMFELYKEHMLNGNYKIAVGLKMALHEFGYAPREEEKQADFTYTLERV